MRTATFAALYPDELPNDELFEPWIVVSRSYAPENLSFPSKRQRERAETL